MRGENNMRREVGWGGGIRSTLCLGLIWFSAKDKDDKTHKMEKRMVRGGRSLGTLRMSLCFWNEGIMGYKCGRRGLTSQRVTDQWPGQEINRGMRNPHMGN